MQELVSPMIAKDYRNTINNNFNELNECIENNQKLIHENTNEINVNFADLSNSMIDIQEEIMSRLEEKIDKRFHKLEQNQEKILAGIDVMYNITKPILIELINETERKKILLNTPKPKSWYKFW